MVKESKQQGHLAMVRVTVSGNISVGVMGHESYNGFLFKRFTMKRINKSSLE